MRLLSRRSHGPVAFLIFCLAALLLTASAQAKPNFSGEWKLQVAKSEFGPLPAPTSRTDKITHEDPSLKLTVTQSGQSGEVTYDLNYTTDGKETANQVRGNTLKSVSKWEGDVLVIDTKANFGGNEITIKDKWSLSEDGKTITINRHLAGPQGEADQKLVMEKQ